MAIHCHANAVPKRIIHAGGQTAPLGPSNAGATGLRLIWPTMEQVCSQPASMASRSVLEILVHPEHDISPLA